GNTSGTAGVRYRTQDGTALDGLNYVAAAGTLEFAPLQTDAVIRIELLQDHVFRGRPHFYLELYESSVPARLDRRRQIVVHDREPGMVTGSTFTWLEGKKEMEFDVTALDWHDGYQVEDSFDLIQWNPNGLVRHFGPRRPGFVYSSGVSKTTFEMLEIGREERRFFRIRRP
ncbi:MAG: Calx-beta domain-containing protein, partial [Limisphaerales bacterium]